MTEKKMETVLPAKLSFDGLYSTYFADIYRFAFSLTGNDEEAGDIAQDTFIKLFRQMEDGIELLTPKAWIYRVAANDCFNLLKRRKKFRSIIEYHFKQPQNPRLFNAPGIEEDLIKKQETELMRQAMLRLPPRDRVILTLYKEGFSTTQLAQLLEVKKNSIGKILARSIEKLSKVIDGFKSNGVNNKGENP